jgi:hypothetical protein
MVNDSSPNDTGIIDNLTVFIEPQQITNGFNATIPADSWYYDFVDVPADATNLVDHRDSTRRTRRRARWICMCGGRVPRCE